MDNRPTYLVKILDGTKWHDYSGMVIDGPTTTGQITVRVTHDPDCRPVDPPVNVVTHISQIERSDCAV